MSGIPSVCSLELYYEALEDASSGVSGQSTIALAFKNLTKEPLRLRGSEFQVGEWFEKPPPELPPGRVAIMSAHNKPFHPTGVAGVCVYEGPDVAALLAFETPLFGATRSYIEVGARDFLKEVGDLMEYATARLEIAGVLKEVPVATVPHRCSCYGERDLTFIVEQGPFSGDARSSRTEAGDYKASGVVKETAYYELLEVPVDATPEAIRKAWRKMALKYHPDKHPDDPDADGKFKALAEAYETLGDPGRRSQYDRHGKQGLTGPGSQEEVHHKMLNLLFGEGRFTDVFGPPERVFERPIPTVGEERVLRAKLWTCLERFAENEKLWTAEVLADVNEKVQASGGQGILLSVGYVYVFEARRGDRRNCCVAQYFAGHQDRFRGYGKDCSSMCKLCGLVCGSARMLRDVERFERREMTQEQMDERAKPIMMEHLHFQYDYGLQKIEAWSREVCQGLIPRLEGAKGFRMLEGLERLGLIYMAAGKDGGLDVAAVLEHL